MALTPFDLKCFASATIVFLWHLSIYRLKMIPFDHKKMAYDQNRFSSAAFLLFLVICIFMPSNVPRFGAYLASIVCSYIYVGFAILHSQKQETFWQKRRNRLLGMASLTVIAVILPQFISFPILFPVLFSMVTTQICHASSYAFFVESMLDIEAVRKKILEVNAQRSSDQVLAECSEEARSSVV